MFILSWNVKGLDCPSKRSRVKDFLKMHCIDIIMLQESKIAFTPDSFFRSIGGNLIIGWRHLNSGGQLIGWNDIVFE